MGVAGSELYHVPNVANVSNFVITTLQQLTFVSCSKWLVELSWRDNLSIDLNAFLGQVD